MRESSFEDGKKREGEAASPSATTEKEGKSTQARPNGA